MLYSFVSSHRMTKTDLISGSDDEIALRITWANLALDFVVVVKMIATLDPTYFGFAGTTSTKISFLYVRSNLVGNSELGLS